MPSPAGHFLGAMIAHTLTAAPDEIGLRRRACVIAAAALAPDLDLLLRFVDGRNHHQGAAHSIGAACLAAGAVALFAAARGWSRPLRLGAAAGLGWSSHLLLDYLGRDTSPPIGLLALWPFSSGHYKFPFPLFLDIGRTLDLHTLGHNGLALAWEALMLSPLLVASWRWRHVRGGA